MRYVWIILFVWMGCTAYAQKATIDSLQKVIATTKVDTTKGRTLCALCNMLTRTGNLEEALRIGNAGLALLERKKDEIGLLECYNEVGNGYWGMGDYPQALVFYRKGMALAQQRQDHSKIATFLVSIGIVYWSQGDFKQAAQHFQESLTIFESLDDEKGIARACGNLGMVYQDQGNYPASLAYLYRGLKLFERQKDELAVASSLGNIAGIYHIQKKYDKALANFNRSLQIFEKYGAENSVALTLMNIGVIHDEQGRDSFALAYYEQSRRMNQKIGDLRNVATVLVNIGKIYLKKRDVKKSLQCQQEAHELYAQIGDSVNLILTTNNFARAYLELGQLQQAKKYADQAWNAARKVNHLGFMRDVAATQSRIDSLMGNYQSALRYYHLHKKYSDSLTNTDKAQEIGHLEAQFQYDRQIEARQKDEEVAQHRRQRYYYLFGGIFMLVLMLTGFIYYRYQSKNKTNRLLTEKNTLITNQKAELENAYEELNTTLDQVQIQKVELENAYEELNATLEQVQYQKEEIVHKNQKIEDSIRYAYQIQTAILPDDAYLKSLLPNHFIFYQPKDIVSGDFYWVTERDNLIFFCVADCTGHGVPGAFMSVVGSNALHHAVNELGLNEPHSILHETDRKIRSMLHQEKGSESKDGMDIGLCVLDTERLTLDFAGAGRPLYHLSNGNLAEIKGDKFPIGGGQHEEKSFTLHRDALQKGDRIYLFSDGITDQFGGANKKKFTPKRLQEFIVTNRLPNIVEQGILFRETMTTWMHGQVQLDDLTLMAVEV